jgi:hypothetical protein
MHKGFWWESQKEDLEVGGRIILRWILERERMVWYGPVEGPCEHGKELSGSMKCCGILEWLPNWRLLKNVSAPWS